MKTILNIKVDKVTKIKAKAIADALGLPLSTIVNAFLHQFIREEKVTFSKTPSMSDYLEKKLAPIERDIRQKKNISTVIKDKKDIGAFFAGTTETGTGAN